MTKKRKIIENNGRSKNLKIQEKKDIKEKKKQIAPAKGWMFTYNNYEEHDIKYLQEVLKDHKYIFQEEKGQNGTEHLQGWVTFKTKVRPLSIVNRKDIHWEKQKGADKEAREYCSKTDTRNGGIYTNIEIPRKVIDIFDKTEMYDWQKELITIVKKVPSEREVYWYWSEKGGTGKSKFAKHLILKYDALVVGGKANNIHYGVSKWIELKEEIKIIVIDIARSEGNNVSYKAIEDLKNGHFFSGKYESGMCVFNEPHVIIFSNYPPEIPMLSENRWIIKEIK